MVRDTEMLQFLYIYDHSPRPELVSDPDSWTEEEIGVYEAHFAYLQRAAEQGKVLLAGRAQDGVGPGLVIFEAPSEAAAREFMEHDPFVAEGLFGARLHPFRIALARE